MKFRIPTLSLVLAFTAVAVGCNDANARTPTTPSPGGESTQRPPASGGDRISVAGTVSDATWRPLPGARVEVVDGPEAGLLTTTDAAGQFGLVGAFTDATRFRATEKGHVAAILPFPAKCDQCRPNWWIHFYLESLRPPVNIAGHYTMTFVADGACIGLPEEARTRIYEAMVTLRSRPGEPANSWFDVAMTNRKFLDRHNGFEIRVVGNDVAADIGDWGHGSPGLMEEIAERTYLMLGGELRTSVTDTSRIAGSLHGAIERCAVAANGGAPGSCSELAFSPAACWSRNHQFTLTRIGTSKEQ